MSLLMLQVSMAGISVDENAVEEFNQMRGKSTVCGDAMRT